MAERAVDCYVAALPDGQREDVLYLASAPLERTPDRPADDVTVLVLRRREAHRIAASA